jgi:hypothetical protein
VGIRDLSPPEEKVAVFEEKPGVEGERHVRRVALER